MGDARIRLLTPQKAGFAHDGEVPDEEVGTAWRFRLERQAQFSTK